MSEDTTSWEEIVAFLAENFGISLNKKSDKYLGYLRMSQVNCLINGYTKLKNKENEATKKASGDNSGRMSASSMGELKHIPGVVVKNRKKK